ncbi:MAG: ESX secretion-associated protein EspG, partial [Pseudonocardiaceae bacterium]
MHSITVELTHEEYRTAWQTLGLGIRHWNMDLPGLPVLTEQERRAQMAHALEGLRSRGLVDHQGFDPALEGSLRLLATPVHEINGWMHSTTGHVRLLAGSR